MIEPCQASVDEVLNLASDIRDTTGHTTLGPVDREISGILQLTVLYFQSYKV